MWSASPSAPWPEAAILTVDSHFLRSTLLVHLVAVQMAGAVVLDHSKQKGQNKSTAFVVQTFVVAWGEQPAMAIWMDLA